MALPPILVGDIFEACELARNEFMEGKITMKEYLLKIRELTN